MDKFKIGDYVVFDPDAHINQHSTDDVPIVFDIIFQIEAIDKYVTLKPHIKLEDRHTWYPSRFKLSKKYYFDQELERIINGKV